MTQVPVLNDPMTDAQTTSISADGGHEPPNVGGLPAELMAEHQPLTNREWRQLFTMVSEIHETIGEIRAMKENFPQLVADAPPMVRMMMQGFLK